MAGVVLGLVIAWLLAVVGTAVWVGIRGRRLYVVTRTAQAGFAQFDRTALEQLPECLEELERSQARLAEAIAGLQAAVAEFMVLWRAFSSVTGQLQGIRSFFTTK